jgi:hypothetical protein
MLGSHVLEAAARALLAGETIECDKQLYGGCLAVGEVTGRSPRCARTVGAGVMSTRVWRNVVGAFVG